jgi:hypothetical protein
MTTALTVIFTIWLIAITVAITLLCRWLKELRHSRSIESLDLRPLTDNSVQYNRKMDAWYGDKYGDPYWGEVGLDDEDFDARDDWESLERSIWTATHDPQHIEPLTGEELEIFSSYGPAWADLASRSYDAVQLHEVIVNCLRTADEEDVSYLLPKIPERYFALPFNRKLLEDLYETLWILMDNPQWEGENPSECWPRTNL